MRVAVGVVILGAFFLISVREVFAAGLTVDQGGTGTTTIPTNYVMMGNTPLRIKAVATSSLGITGTPAGADTQVQFNDGGVFGGDADFTWSKLLNLLSFTSASTSLFTVSGTQWITPLATGAGAFLAVDNLGKIIATTSPTTGGGIVGPGTVGQNAFYSAVNTVTGTSSLFTATSGNIGIGTTTPATLLSLTGGNLSMNTTANTNSSTLLLTELGTTLGFIQQRGTAAASLPNRLKIATQSGTNGDLVLGTNAQDYLFIAGGQNGLTAGNVGIGTSSPASLLTVQSSAGATYPLLVQGSTAGGLFRVRQTGGNDFFMEMFSNLGDTTSNVVRLNTNGNSYLNGGNVGIGTTTPGNLLVVGNGTANLAVPFNKITAVDTGDARIGAVVNNAGTFMRYNSSGGYGDLFAYDYTGAGAKNLILNQFGANVGIGTTTPASLFDVNGTATVWGDLDLKTTNSLRFGPAANVTAGWNSGASSLVFAGSPVLFNAGLISQTVTPQFRAGISNDVATYLQINGGTSGYTYFNGNVGIGNTSPSGKLDIQANASTPLLVTSDSFFYTVFQANGNSGQTGLNLVTKDSGGTNYNGYVYQTSGGINFQGPSSGILAFGQSTNASGGALVERMRIGSTGNVGIGTTTPFNALTIAGASFAGASIVMERAALPYVQFGATATGGLSFLTDAGLERGRFESGGNFGIGTSTPVSKLTVNGDIGTDGTNVTVSGCGTSPAITVGSTDTAGEITQGTISTGCTISFSSTKARAPFCTVTSKAGLGFTYAVSSSAITITNVGALSSTAVVYHCIQNNL